ncbi:DNA gyrase inhibitor YacG [Magnetovibrio sp. PR-2]|uniref:DNA gyrase inhibitor YacG n=1 Tax=Magnetovibrio sp. PR-2 TaxID=3120356 RepID=UPI002FCE1FB7
MSDENVVKLKISKPQKTGGKSCPVCQKPVQKAYQPFCSKRCADIDLGKWLGEGYRIPSDEPAGFDDGWGDED